MIALLGAIFADASMAHAAQAGSNDSSFNTLDDGYFPQGSGQRVLACALQPDGKWILPGKWVLGSSSSGLTRLNLDGSVDLTFNDNSFGEPVGILLQPDGRVLLGAASGNQAGVRRLNANGSVDTTFNAGFAGGFSLALQSDGKILVGSNGFGVARLHSNGALDSSFNSGLISGVIRAMVVQADGKIVIGGNFSTIQGTTIRGLARLHPDGSLDPTFQANLTALSGVDVRALCQQPDGRILVGGYFFHANSVARSHIARLHSDGAVDTSFNPVGGASSQVYAIHLDASGRSLIAGSFTTVNGVVRRYIARLNADGSVDSSFDPGAGAGSMFNYVTQVFSVCIRPNGKILVGGEFDLYCGRVRYNYTQINSDGSHDISFAPRRGAESQVSIIEVQPDRKILVGGWFHQFNDEPRTQLVRLNEDGSVDTGFVPSPSANITQVTSLKCQPDGKVLVCGRFIVPGLGYTTELLKRLNIDGSVDSTFVSLLSNGGASVYSIVLQPDGKILAGGNFSTVGGAPRGGVVRLNSDGTLDTTFDPGPGGPGQGVNSIVLQPDGKILVAGAFGSFGGVPRNDIARLHSDGSLDVGFNPVGPGPGGWLEAMVLQPDGRILLGGNFNSYGGIAAGGVARILSDGTTDVSFGASPWNGGYVYRMALLPTGQLIVAGSFPSSPYPGHIARLHPNGSRDFSFNFGGSGANTPVHGMALQPDGKVLIGGQFTTFNGITRTRVARLLADPCPVDSDGDGFVDCIDNCVNIVNPTQGDCDADGLGDACEFAAGVQWDTNGNGTPDQCEACPSVISYCTAGTSTNGCVALMTASGNPSVAATSGFVLRANYVEGQKQGLLFYGLSGPNNAPWATGSTSRLCVRAPSQRLLNLSSGGTANFCNGALQADFLSYLASNPTALGVPFAVGTVVNAQAWFRDPPAPGTTNLSNGLQFKLCP